MIYAYTVQGRPPRLVLDVPERPCVALAVTAALYEAVCAAVDQYGDRVHAHLHEGLRHGLWTLQQTDNGESNTDAHDTGTRPGPTRPH
jgi:cytosine/adenosine deaminase-related metal-dependent hydrolase